MRLVQHKREAYWFYRFLSIFYDKYVNPLFWNERMRDESLELAQLDSPNLSVIDVGSGTGFTTQGIVQKVSGKFVTCVDQSPHQMAKAKAKPDLRDCTFKLGDAENIPAETDQYDRYVSAGSIEYWPNPQQGVNEAYRVIKPGGVALMIGPLEPEQGFARYMANTWMLFPPDEDYRRWFAEAGFHDIQVRYIRPAWYRRQGEYGIAIAGTKPAPGLSPAATETKTSEEPKKEKMSFGRWIQLFFRVLIGSLAGFIFIPIAILGYLGYSLTAKNKGDDKYREGLNRYQIGALIVIALLIGLAIFFAAR